MQCEYELTKEKCIWFISLFFHAQNQTIQTQNQRKKKKITCMEFRNKTKFIDANSSYFYSFNLQKKETP